MLKSLFAIRSSKTSLPATTDQPIGTWLAVHRTNDVDLPINLSGQAGSVTPVPLSKTPGEPFQFEIRSYPEHSKYPLWFVSGRTDLDTGCCWSLIPAVLLWARYTIVCQRRQSLVSL